MIEFKDLGIAPTMKGFMGDKIKITSVYNVDIVVEAFKVGPSKYADKEERLDMQILIDGVRRVTWISSKNLIDMIRKVPSDKFPFKTKIILNNNRPEFT